MVSLNPQPCPRCLRLSCQCKHGPSTVPAREIARHMAEAEQKAWECLAGSKWQMFAREASLWVHLNRLGNFRKPNPFGELVGIAARRKRANERQS